MTDLVRDHKFLNILMLMFKREYFLIVKCWGAVCRSCDGNNKELKGINEGTRKCLDT